jgi:hypothetical protein
VLTLDSGADRLTVRFDTRASATTPGRPAVSPVACDLGFFPASPGELFYRFTLDTTAGFVPARVDPKSHDPRDLGVFLRAYEMVPLRKGDDSPGARPFLK